jgi:hypothetical protein
MGIPIFKRRVCGGKPEGFSEFRNSSGYIILSDSPSLLTESILVKTFTISPVSQRYNASQALLQTK